MIEWENMIDKWDELQKRKKKKKKRKEIHLPIENHSINSINYQQHFPIIPVIITDWIS